MDFFYDHVEKDKTIFVDVIHNWGLYVIPFYCQQLLVTALN
jgi:hypothetical protein